MKIASLEGLNAIKLTDGSHEVMTYVSFGASNWPNYNSYDDAEAWLKLIRKRFSKVDLRLADTLQWRNALIDNLMKDLRLIEQLQRLDLLAPFFKDNETPDANVLARQYDLIKAWIEINQDLVNENKQQVTRICDEWTKRMRSKLKSPKITTSRWDECLKNPFYESRKAIILQNICTSGAEPGRSETFSKAFYAVHKERIAEVTKRGNYHKILEELKTSNQNSHQLLLRIITVLCFDYLLEEAAEAYNHKLNLSNNIVYVYPVQLNRVVDFIVKRSLSDDDDGIKINFLQIKLDEVKPEVVHDSDSEETDSDKESASTSTLPVAVRKKTPPSPVKPIQPNGKHLNGVHPTNGNHHPGDESNGKLSPPQIMLLSQLASGLFGSAKTVGYKNGGSHVLSDKSPNIANGYSVSTSEPHPPETDSMESHDSQESPRSQLNEMITEEVAELLKLIPRNKIVSLETMKEFRKKLIEIFNIVEIEPEQLSTQTSDSSSTTSNTQTANKRLSFGDIKISFNKIQQPVEVTQQQFNTFWNSLLSHHENMTTAKRKYQSNLHNLSRQDENILDELSASLYTLERFINRLHTEFKTFLKPPSPEVPRAVTEKPPSPEVTRAVI